MRKPRMTRSEKAFVKNITEVVFDSPKPSTMNSKKFAELSKEEQDRFIRLTLTKTY